MKQLLLALVTGLVSGLVLTARPALAEPHTIFLMDVSGSMEFPVAGAKRIDLAKSALLGTLATGRYPGAELIMWNTGKQREDYGDGAKLAGEVMAAPQGDSGSYLGSAFLSIRDAGYRCSHVVFVTDEYPDDAHAFRQAIIALTGPHGLNAVTVYVVNHAESYYYADRFAAVSDSQRYRVIDGNRHGSLADYLQANPVTDTCGTLS